MNDLNFNKIRDVVKDITQPNRKNLKTLLAEKYPTFTICLLSRCKHITECWDLETLKPKPNSNIQKCKTFLNALNVYSKPKDYHFSKAENYIAFSPQELSLIILGLRLLSQEYKEKAQVLRLLDKLSYVNSLYGKHTEKVRIR